LSKKKKKKARFRALFWKFLKVLGY